MGRPEECAELIKQGDSPGLISVKLGISISSVIDYLYRAVGKNRLWLSEIAFSIPEETRDAVETLISDLRTHSPGPIDVEARRRGISWVKEEFRLYLHLRQSLLGDLYYFIAFLENAIHEVIRSILISEFGRVAEAWWENGIPDQIRAACVGYRESDPDPTTHPFDYTQFSHLWKIIDEQWHVFERYLPPDAIGDKALFISDIKKACRIRNRVMHPVRGVKFSQDDFDFIRDLTIRIESENWGSILRDGAT